MVAWAGFVNLRQGLALPAPDLTSEILAGTIDEYVDVNPRWPLGVKHWKYETVKAPRSVKKKKTRMSLTEETRLRESAL